MTRVSFGEITANGLYGLKIEVDTARDLTTPFEPSIYFSVSDGEDNAEIAGMSIGAARKLAYTILAECEAALIQQDADLHYHKMIAMGAMTIDQLPDTAAPSIKNTLAVR